MQGSSVLRNFIHENTESQNVNCEPLEEQQNEDSSLEEFISISHKLTHPKPKVSCVEKCEFMEIVSSSIVPRRLVLFYQIKNLLPFICVFRL